MALATATTAALIGGGASVVGAGLQYRAGRQAASDQRRAVQQAIDLERSERERRQQAMDRKRQEDLNARNLAFMNWYNQFGDEGIRRYGIPAGIDASLYPAPSSGPSAGPRSAPPPPQSTNLGRMTGLMGPMDSQQPGPTALGNGTLGNMVGWNEWDQYLGR